MTHGTQKFNCIGDNLWDVQQLGCEEWGVERNFGNEIFCKKCRHAYI